MPPTSGGSRAAGAGRWLGAVAALWTGTAAAYLLQPNPLADVFFAGWVVFACTLAVVGAVSAWTRRPPLVWVAAFLLVSLSIAGMWSIGPFIAPAALLLLVAALLVQAAERGSVRREPVTVDRTTVRRAAVKSLAGTGGLVVGTWLAYEGALVRELFRAACGTETLACALAVTQWDAVGLTALGLGTVVASGWLVWNQVPIGRAVLVRRSA